MLYGAAPQHSARPSARAREHQRMRRPNAPNFKQHNSFAIATKSSPSRRSASVQLKGSLCEQKVPTRPPQRSHPSSDRLMAKSVVTSTHLRKTGMGMITYPHRLFLQGNQTQYNEVGGLAISNPSYTARQTGVLRNRGLL